MRRLTPLLLALLALAAAAPAGDAEDVPPAGQSELVSLGGVLSGAGSPHLYDQLPLFTSFEYKPYALHPAAVGAPSRRRLA